MKDKIILTYFLFLCLIISLVKAAPYGSDGMDILFEQKNGQTINLKIYGDEFYAVTKTLDEFTVIFDADKKSYCYALLNSDKNNFISSGKIVGENLPLESSKHLNLSSIEIEKIVTKNRAELNPTEKSFQKNKTRAISEGSAVGFTFLLKFPDDVNTAPIESKINNILNMKDYDKSTGGNKGSVRDYFLDQSNGKLDLTSEISPWITLPNPRAYYNFIDYPQNTTYRANSAAGKLLIIDAITTYRQLGAPNWNKGKFTLSPNGTLPFLNILISGPSSGIHMLGLWPHKSQNGNIPEIHEGVKYWEYQLTNINWDTETYDPPVGTIIHESGHMICGFPDLYGKIKDQNGAVGSHCLMGNGGGNGNKRCPSDLNPYFKISQGWITPIDFNQNDYEENIKLSYSENTILRYRNPKNSKEYFLIDYRAPTGKWSEHATAKGVHIWHIDEDFIYVPVSGQMQLNNHDLISLEQADGLFNIEGGVNLGDGNDSFFSNGGKIIFDSTTTPNSKWWDGTSSGLRISDVGINTGLSTTLTIGIPPPGIIVINNPNSEDEFLIGQNFPINWTSVTPGNLKIELHNSDGLVKIISPQVAINSSLFDWLIPDEFNMQRQDYYLSLTSLDNNAIQKKSKTFGFIKEYTYSGSTVLANSQSNLYSIPLSILDDGIIADVDFRINLTTQEKGLIRHIKRIYLGHPSTSTWDDKEGYAVGRNSSWGMGLSPSNMGYVIYSTTATTLGTVFDEQSTNILGTNPTTFPSRVKYDLGTDITSLADLNGLNAKGTWHLFTTGLNLGSGKINSWGLRIKFKRPEISLAQEVISVNMGNNAIIPITIDRKELTSTSSFDIPFELFGSAKPQVNFTVSGVKSFDYITGKGIITAPENATNVNLTINLLENSYRIGDKDLTMKLSYPDSNKAFLNETTFTKRIILQDLLTPPNVNFDLSETSFTTDFTKKDIIIPINLSQVSGEIITVDYAITGTAEKGIHHDLEENGSFTFSPGKTHKSLTIPILNSNEITTKTLSIQLTNIINASEGNKVNYNLTLQNKSENLEADLTNINEVLLESSQRNIVTILIKKGDYQEPLNFNPKIKTTLIGENGTFIENLSIESTCVLARLVFKNIEIKNSSKIEIYRCSFINANIIGAENILARSTLFWKTQNVLQIINKENCASESFEGNVGSIDAKGNIKLDSNNDAKFGPKLDETNKPQAGSILINRGEKNNY